MANKLRWGILGTGTIATKFASQLPDSTRGELVATGSRSQESADKFAVAHGGVGRGSYDDLIADESVEAIYISLPNSMHGPWSIKAMQAGKQVLCEKPIASNADEARQMFQVASTTGQTLVEAFMYRSHPAIEKFIEIARSGEIGELKLIRSNFTFAREVDPDDCRYRPELAGGSIMDVGCYCVNLTRALAGREPTSAYAIANIHNLGVDEYAAGLLNFDNELLATFTSGMTVDSDRTTYVAGTKGQLEIDTPWFADGTFLITRNGKTEKVEVAGSDKYYALEADAFAATVQDGSPPSITKEDTIGNMVVLDELRQSAGLSY